MSGSGWQSRRAGLRNKVGATRTGTGKGGGGEGAPKRRWVARGARRTSRAMRQHRASSESSRASLCCFHHSACFQAIRRRRGCRCAGALGAACPSSAALAPPEAVSRRRANRLAGSSASSASTSAAVATLLAAADSSSSSSLVSPQRSNCGSARMIMASARRSTASCPSAPSTWSQSRIVAGAARTPEKTVVSHLGKKKFQSSSRNSRWAPSRGRSAVSMRWTSS
mmetsp:Transcript_125744/g.350333  ORF Transcript_125744/g.350333 Transcript_125744/m.350333 type:complete len:225 (-) Transcript_125744:70-744(-)